MGVMSLIETLYDRLRGEFQKTSVASGGSLMARSTTPATPAVIWVDEEELSVTVQACDFVTGDLVWQATFTADSPLELILVTARSAADADR